MIGIVSDKKTDLHFLLEQNGIQYTQINMKDRLDDYEAIMVLGGTAPTPLELDLEFYDALEKFTDQGGKLFLEYVASFGPYLSEGIKPLTNERLVMINDNYDLVSAQYSNRTINFNYNAPKDFIIAAFSTEHAHESLKTIEDNIEPRNYAIFKVSENVLISNVQLSFYNRNRYAPINKFHSVIASIMKHLSIEDSLLPLPSPYSLEKTKDSKEAVQKILNWFDQNHLLLEKGKKGVLEGFGSEIYYDGKQRLATTLRADCIGEAAGFYYWAGKFLKRDDLIEISENLFKSSKEFVIKEGPYQGFVRWSNIALESNYGDDVARMLIPLILINLIEGSSEEDIDLIELVCDFHLKTTGIDGLRRSRIEFSQLNTKFIEKVKFEKGSSPSAHYNSYYHAMLLLAYKLIGKREYLDYGLKGLDTLLDIYPDTLREQSQTQEEARLIFPLSIAYWISSNVKYKKALDQVFEDLISRKNENGCFVEWDTGYKAVMRHTKGDGECSLLAHNGDKVADLLYTNNWLPVGFVFAYIATNDPKYLEEANSIVEFMLRTQIHSKNKTIDGVWMRAFDSKLFEYYGSPADKGWGPYCIESGWTVSQIGTGIILLELLDELKIGLEVK